MYIRVFVWYPKGVMLDLVIGSGNFQPFLAALTKDTFRGICPYILLRATGDRQTDRHFLSGSCFSSPPSPDLLRVCLWSLGTSGQGSLGAGLVFSELIKEQENLLLWP